MNASGRTEKIVLRARFPDRTFALVSSLLTRLLGSAASASVLAYSIDFV